LSIVASIIIPTRDRRALLCALLDSLARELRGREDVEVIVVDDASCDGTASVMAERFPWVRLEVAEKPMGPSAARNRAERVASGRLLLFLDADGEVAEGWLAAVLSADDDRTVLLGNVVDFLGGRVQSVPRRSTFLGKSLRCRPEKANTGPSCNLGVPKVLFDSLCGFDEELPYYFEDSDLCIRAKRAGARFRFVAEAAFRHHGSEVKRGEAIRLQEANSVYAMLKGYEGDWVRMAVFTLGNWIWLQTRVVLWCLAGRWRDTKLLVRGWAQGNMRYFGARL
jgi:GT2 family glycosyltransferase